jgi:hypothetical protein
MVPERLDGCYSYSVFKILPIIGRCPAKIIAAQKIAPKNMAIIYNDSNNFD